MSGWDWVWIALGLFVLLWLAAVVVLIAAGRKVAAKELATLLPNLVLLFKDLFADPRVPTSSKILLGFGVLWLVSPIDLLPEFLPGIGPLDDAIVAALILRHLVRRAGAAVVADQWRGDPRTLRLILRVAGLRDELPQAGEPPP
jgi:uncharacterized membrane protein YkvA (DUF1232 family)